MVLLGLDIGKDLNYPLTLELCGVCTGEGWNGTGMMGCFLWVSFDLFFLKQQGLTTELEKMWVGIGAVLGGLQSWKALGE